MQKQQVTSFSRGFDAKGHQNSLVGLDVINMYKAPSTWNKDEDGEKPVGTPVQIDTATAATDFENFDVQLCANGEKPNGYLAIKVGNHFEEVNEFYNLPTEPKSRPGEACVYIRHREGGYLDTCLFDEGITLAAEDEVYINNGKFTNVDPTGDSSGVVIGTVERTYTEYGTDRTFAWIRLA